MFKERLKEASAWVLALIIIAIIIAIPLGLVALTGLINKSLPEYIFTGFIVLFWTGYLGYCTWKWINWQFVEPYKAAKAAKKSKGE